MTDSLVSAGICAAFVGIAIAVVLGSYFAARTVLGREESERTHETAAAVGTRIATLYGLILALVYAQELSDYKDIRSALVEEAVAIADVYNDIRRYGGPDVVPVQKDIRDYLITAAGPEWDSLGRAKILSPRAWADWEDVYQRVLDLRPSTDREHFLANRMRDRITTIARLRQTRTAPVGEDFSGVFWPPAIIGLVLLAIPFYVSRPSRSHLVLLSVFGAYSGVILFFIYAFSNPFQEPARIEPLAFKRLQLDFAKPLPKPASASR